MNSGINEEKAIASQEMQDPSGEGTTQSPRAGSGLVMNRPPVDLTVERPFSAGITNYTEYYMAHVTSSLTFDSVPVLHHRGCFDCYYCRLKRVQRNRAVRGLGFLSDLFNNPDPTLARTADLFGSLFRIATEKRVYTWIDKLHHFNVSLYHMPPSKVDMHIVHQVQNSLMAHFHYLSNRSLTCPYFRSGLDGGVKEKKAEKVEELKDVKHRPKKQEKKQKKRDLRRDNNKPVDPELVVLPQPVPAGGDAAEVPGVIFPDSFSSAAGETKYSFGSSEEAPAKSGKPKQQQHSKGGRANFRNEQVGRQVAQEGAREAGNRDAVLEIREARERAQRDAEQAERDQKDQLARHKQALANNVYAGGPRASEFSARPILNVGLQCRRSKLTYLLLLMSWRSFTLPTLATCAAVIFKCIKNTHSLPNLLVAGGSTFLGGFISAFILYVAAGCFSNPNPKFASRKIFFKANIRPETRVVSLFDEEGDLVDTRPSEIKIGKTEMTQLEQEAHFTVPTLVVATPQEHHAEGVPTISVTRDPEFERRLLTVPFFENFANRHAESAACLDERNVLSTRNTNVSWTLSGVYKEAFVDPLLARGHRMLSRGAFAVRRVMNWFLRDAVTDKDHTIVALNPGNDMSFSVVDAQGNVNVWKTAAVGCLAALVGNTEFRGDAPAMVGSHSSVVVSAPGFRPAEAVPVPRVFRAVHTTLPFCSHSYNNAATYGALSSQVSPDSNYAMLYRKLSRYTAIAQNRFGNKELVTNAEILARLRYWAVREKPEARAAAAHF